MTIPRDLLDRRHFLAQSAAAAGAMLLSPQIQAAPKAAEANPIPICGFVKFVQQLSYSQLADQMAEMGFNGIEATARANGLFEPERAAEELPKLVDALKKNGLEVTILTTNVNRADEKSATLLKTAAALGVKRYRMQYYRYDLTKPVWPQLQELKSVVKDLAAMNAELGVTGLYQNHAGASYVGAPLWDLRELLDGISPSQVASAYDIRHATMEGGSTWLTSWNMIQPYLGAVFVKDFKWNGRRPEEVALGKGVIDPAFFAMLNVSKFAGPLSLHVEYLPKGNLAENLDALRTDIETLRKLLASTDTKPRSR
ncbi:sugar phosphate isomerase/epimerase family protein [Planctomicrobium sp. SH664]|uniref:sugar phosphate isomerase/epimerase family protein n=1 Tax=Planctomicrobium sp. SH664 TaxID=3448125 RepID=UPI003F5B832B